MVNQTTAYKNATYKLTKETKIKVDVWWNDHNYASLFDNPDATFTDEDFALNSISYDNQSIDGTNGNAFMLGSVYTGRFQAGFLKTDSNNLDINKFYKAYIKAFYGIKTGTNSWEYVSIGKFCIYEAVETDALISITAYDSTVRFDEEYNEERVSKSDPRQIFTDILNELRIGYIDYPIMRNKRFIDYMSPVDLSNNIITYKWDKDTYATRRELLSDLCQIMCGFMTANREPDDYYGGYDSYYRFICPSFDYNDPYASYSSYEYENRTKRINLVDNDSTLGTSGLYPTKTFKSFKVKNAINSSQNYFCYNAIRMHCESTRGTQDILVKAAEIFGEPYIAIGDYTALTTIGYYEGHPIEVEPEKLYTFTTKLLKYNTPQECECVAKHVFDYLVGDDAEGQLITFIPLELETSGDISIELGDNLFITYNSKNYLSLVSSINWKYKQNEVIKSPDKLLYLEDSSNNSSYQQKQLDNLETNSQSFFGAISERNINTINIPDTYNSGTGYEYGDLNLGTGTKKIKTTIKNNTTYLTGSIQVSADRNCALYIRIGKTINDTAMYPTIDYTTEFSYQLNQGINNIQLSRIFSGNNKNELYDKSIDVNNNNIIGLFFKKSDSSANVYIPANGAKIALIGNII